MNFNFFKGRKNREVRPTTKVYRQQVIEGVSIPAFIRNGSYFFTDLHVYENGRVYCWNFEDLEHFTYDVRRGWVMVSVPDNEEISIHGLGAWTVTNGSWIFNRNGFIDYVMSLIKEMNPKMESIFKYREKIENGVRVGENGKGTIYKTKTDDPNRVFPEKIKGNDVDLFYKAGDEYYLTNANVFADYTIHLSRLEKPLRLTFRELEELIDQKIVVTEVPVNARVHIYGLGSFNAGKNAYVASIDQKLLEMKDMVKTLNGEPDSIDICREAYQRYMENPTNENKERLKISYENVPHHTRMYVGDMDTKDIAVRMIIYGDQEIENWSHYKLAKQMGDELPVIKVPKPNDTPE